MTELGGKMSKIQYAVVALAAFASLDTGTAQAGGPRSLKDEPYAIFSWTGPYAGIQAGYGWSNSRYSDENYLSKADPDGFIGGAYAGYNYQRSDRLVLGIEADITYSGMKGSDGQRFLSDPSIAIAGVEHDLDVKWSGAVRARLGYATGRFLPYIAGGISFAGYEYRVEDHVNASVPFRHNETRIGWNIGAGFDYAASDRLILRTEYRYTDFGTDNFPNAYSGPLTAIDLQIHDVRFGAAWKF
jgi:outer membrane immunogenic protein